MSKVMHACADIRGMLNFHRRKNSLKGVLTTDEGRPLSDEEARKYLHECLDKGWKVLPMCNCEGFDYQTGCLGHEKG